MPSTTRFDFGDVVLVPFPFTDQRGTKKRPAAVVSSAGYHRAHRDLIIMAITSQPKSTGRVGEVSISQWSQAGLLKPSVVKPVVTTIEPKLVRRKLGRLSPTDRTALQSCLAAILGP